MRKFAKLMREGFLFGAEFLLGMVVLFLMVVGRGLILLLIYLLKLIKGN